MIFKLDAQIGNNPHSRMPQAYPCRELALKTEYAAGEKYQHPELKCDVLMRLLNAATRGWHFHSAASNEQPSTDYTNNDYDNDTAKHTKKVLGQAEQ
jgi:hypothetical protein